jgi:hypothetical protein
MSYLSHDDFVRSEFKDLSKVKEFHDYEVKICRLDNGMHLVKEEDGYALMADTKEHGADSYDKEGCAQQTRIKYYNNGNIMIDFSEGHHHRYYHARQIQGLLSYLPENVHFYETRDKTFLIYDKDEVDVRRRNYNVMKVYEFKKSKVVLKADGSVKGAKEIKRGPKKFAEDKPMKEQLEAKHFREMTKARLDSDFIIDLNKLYATFRGIHTGTFHMALEMHRPSKLSEYGGGPNSGLIRKLHVARFINDPVDIVRANKLALSICSDIPDSCVGPNISALRDKENAS